MVQLCEVDIVILKEVLKELIANTEFRPVSDINIRYKLSKECLRA